MNAVGESPLSNAFTFIAAAVPSRPGTPYWTSRAITSIAIEWNPADENGARISRYDVYMSANSGNYLFKGSSTSNTFLANDLSTGNHYKFRVIPHNDAGEGPSSAQS